MGIRNSLFCLIYVIQSATLTLSFLPSLSFSLTLTLSISFFSIQWVLFFSQVLIRASVPDVPLFVTIQKKRTEFISGKIIDKAEDEEDSDLSAAASAPSKTLSVDYINDYAPGM